MSVEQILTADIGEIATWLARSIWRVARWVLLYATGRRSQLRREAEVPPLRVGQTWQCRDQHYWAVVKAVETDDRGMYFYVSIRCASGTSDDYSCDSGYYRQKRKRAGCYMYDRDLDETDYDLVQLLRDV